MFKQVKLNILFAQSAVVGEYGRQRSARRWEIRLSEDDMARALLGLRGVPGKTGRQNDATAKKNIDVSVR